MKCESCDSVTINGVFCHEAGCPDAWKNHKYSCKWCGTEFTPESKEDSFVTCSHSCHVAYYGLSCDCEECFQELEDFVQELIEEKNNIK